MDKLAGSTEAGETERQEDGGETGQKKKKREKDQGFYFEDSTLTNYPSLVY